MASRKPGKPRVLVISNTPWRSDNSFGNTYNAFFGGMDCEIANVYCRSGLPDSSAPIERAYRITERSLLANLRDSSNPSGELILERSAAAPTESVAFNAARKRRWQILFWARDLLWRLGRWESTKLEAFVDDFAPDILFLPVYYSNYICDLDLWAIEHCRVPVFSNISDDIYSLRRAEVSPLFWVDRFMKRAKIRRVVESCEALYVCSDVQKRDYQECFGISIKVLRKGFAFSDAPELNLDGPNRPLRLLYTGNAGVGRWKSLLDIAEAVSRINAREEGRLLFDIYTPTPLPKRVLGRFGRCLGTTLHGPVPYCEVERLQEGADVLVHVESFKRAGRLTVRQSLSTKIPDYLRRGGCILAYGPAEVASISYLAQSNAAVVVTTRDELGRGIEDILDDPDLVTSLRRRAYAFARENHDINRIQAMLAEDFRVALEAKER